MRASYIPIKYCLKAKDCSLNNTFTERVPIQRSKGLPIKITGRFYPGYCLSIRRLGVPGKPSCLIFRNAKLVLGVYLI